MILIAKLFIVALLFLFSAYIIPGIEVLNFYTALLLAFFWGIISLIVRPILLLFTLPITIITFGLFTFVLNAFLFWFLSTFVKGFEVDSFLSALLGALVISVGSWIGNRVLLHVKE